MLANGVSTLTDHTAVCGLDHPGRRLVERLAGLGPPQVVVTPETSEDWRRGVAARLPLLVGDGRDEVQSVHTRALRRDILG